MYAPVVSVKAMYGTNETDYDLIVAVTNATDMDAAQSEATGLFRQIRGLRPGEDEDFEIFASDSLVSILKENTTNLRLATVAIGLMTLLGAAIGLMNIMLVSVTERTKEIGLRQAVGAKTTDILSQFLAEAVALSLAGGVIGVAAGVSASWLIIAGRSSSSAQSASSSRASTVAGRSPPEKRSHTVWPSARSATPCAAVTARSARIR